MELKIFKTPHELGRAAGATVAELIRQAIKENDAANIILATGVSQFETLNQLIVEKNIDWSKVVMFHLDEYVGIPDTHPASFRKYLRERFILKVPSLKDTFLINPEDNAMQECRRLSELITKHPIDVALAGIGENGHLAFNDPPADFEIEEPYIIVELDEACRKQQMGEGWFASLDEVPKKAISMSIKQILKSKHIICSVPDSRKAIAIKDCFSKPVNNHHPASILQLHENCTCYLDENSSALLRANVSSHLSV